MAWRISRSSIATVLVSGTLVLAGCGGGGGSSSSGGGGGGDSVRGLDLPDNLSVVSADSTERSVSRVARALTGRAVADTSGFAADSDYTQDPTRYYVFDPSMEPLQTVNMILCVMEQTRASDMVNEGAYFALIDENKCEQGQNQSRGGETGQSSSGNQKQLNKWVVNATRADNSSPMVVQIWVPGDPEWPQNILVELTATDGVSSDLPFGAFSMNFRGEGDTGLLSDGPASGTTATTMVGTLIATATGGGEPKFQFIEASGDAVPGVTGMGFERASRATVVLGAANGSVGTAQTEFSESMSGPGGFDAYARFGVDFDADFFLRGKDTDENGTIDASVCTARDDFTNYVWRYNLYHLNDGTYNGQAVSAGDRVNMNGGFPFTYVDGSETKDGFVGYWGVWTESGNVSDGTTITRFNYDTDTTSNYTVNVSAGKLVQRDAQSLLLSELDGGTFEAWGDLGGQGFPQDSGYEAWVVSLSGGNFSITGGLTWGESGPEVTAVGPFAISLSDGDFLDLWSEPLGGMVIYIHDSADLTPEVTFYEQSFVMPDDALLSGGSLTLYCFEQCPIGGVGTNPSSYGDIFYATAPNVGTPYTYTLTSSGGKLVLTDDTAAAAVDFSGLDLSGIGQDWGAMSGAMVTDTSGLTGVYDAWGADTTFQWETGPNEWNQLVTVTDGSGNVASFDQPIKLRYTVDPGDDQNGNDYAGDTFLLEYGGNGDLWGFPWTSDSLGESDFERWYPQVNLKNGVLLADGSGNQFVAKALEVEQTLNADPAGCAGLSVSGLFADASLALLESSDIGSVGLTWAGRPTPANSAPAVIEGELQD